MTLTLEWRVDYREENGGREAIRKLYVQKPKPELRVAWVNAAEREVDAFQRYLEGRNKRTW